MGSVIVSGQIKKGAVSPVSLQDLIIHYLAYFKVHLDQIEATLKA